MKAEKVQLSVLMSVYNETLKDIAEAIESILNQTFSNFELLIVDDNPSRLDHKNLLAEYKKKDSRIIILDNQKNIGLAMSMNKAAAKARSDIFVRMDADDISLPTRFEEQYQLLRSNCYDLVCGRFTSIDEASLDIGLNEIKPEYISSEEIAETLPYKSVIHHPTVMMTRAIFERVNGYRDFPCAQDYDLWLRMLDAKATFAMTNKTILKYRIRESSISGSKKIKQRLTIEYIRDRYIERLRKGKDSFSKEHYQNYLNKQIKNESKDSELIEQGNVILNYAKECEEHGKALYSKLLKCKVLLCNRVYRHVFLKLWVSKIIIKRLRQR
ncbi:MAG: glycosyltransferase [Clostridia bacterium]|nr:glycosyltransferase [Clostridia bacterium]